MMHACMHACMQEDEGEEEEESRVFFPSREGIGMGR